MGDQPRPRAATRIRASCMQRAALKLPPPLGPGRAPEGGGEGPGVGDEARGQGDVAFDASQGFAAKGSKHRRIFDVASLEP